MSGPALDQAAWASRWRRYSPGDKVLLSGGLVISALVLPVWPASPLVALASLGLALGPAGVPASTLARAARGPFLFIVLGTITIAVTWGPGGPTVTAETLDAATVTVAHAVAGTLALLLLAATTPMTDLLIWLRRRGVPEAVVDVAGLTYRLLFVLLESVSAVRAAQTARLGYINRRTTLRSASMLTAATLTRAFDRARRMEAGLAGRGFEGPLRVLADKRPSSKVFVALTMAGLAGLAGLAVLTS